MYKTGHKAIDGIRELVESKPKVSKLRIEFWAMYDTAKILHEKNVKMEEKIESMKDDHRDAMDRLED